MQHTIPEFFHPHYCCRIGGFRLHTEQAFIPGFPEFWCRMPTEMYNEFFTPLEVDIISFVGKRVANVVNVR